MVLFSFVYGLNVLLLRLKATPGDSTIFLFGLHGRPTVFSVFLFSFLLSYYFGSSFRRAIRFMIFGSSAILFSNNTRSILCAYVLFELSP